MIIIRIQEAPMEQNAKQYSKRRAILTCLQNTTAHPSAEMVCRMLQQERPDISVATVYRNLALFKSQGLIQSIGTVSGVERFDYRTDPHVHFICNLCDAVMDLPEIAVPQQLVATAQSATGGQVEQCQLLFTGTCRACVEKQAEA